VWWSPPEDYDDALYFYRDVLGLPEREAFASHREVA
jgi:catechol 2,3-dioxygenase-like lactoylglutathione lyase family enzyme